jgi:CheY-like chemotaxis protein
MPTACDGGAGQLVVVMDDDLLVLDGMRGLLRSWGYRVVAAVSASAALTGLAEQKPDLIISDYCLADDETGIEAIERVRHVFPIPACLITGDPTPERLRAASAGGYQLLCKPVHPATLRTVMGQLLQPRPIPQ